MTFTYDEMMCLRVARARRHTMAEMCAMMPGHSRDAVVEALDALVRHGDTRRAYEHVNRVLVLQAANVSLINGREAHTVSPDHGRATNWAAR